MEKEDEATRAAVAFIYQAAATADILEVWEEVWLEGTPGTKAGIRLYLTEIMELLPSGESCENF